MNLDSDHRNSKVSSLFTRFKKTGAESREVGLIGMWLFALWRSSPHSDRGNEIRHKLHKIFGRDSGRSVGFWFWDFGAAAGKALRAKNLTGALPVDGIACMLSVDREIKTEIPVCPAPGRRDGSSASSHV
jgi:hypothetical protein